MWKWPVLYDLNTTFCCAFALQWTVLECIIVVIVVIITIIIFIIIIVLFLENVDAEEAKSIFESNFSHIYYILYDTFVTAEANLRQRGTVNYLSYTVYFHVVGCMVCVTFSNKQTVHASTKQRLCLSLHYELKIQMKFINHSFIFDYNIDNLRSQEQWNGMTSI
jgi:hypothetical protein